MAAPLLHRGDVVTHADHGDTHYIVFGRASTGTPLYSASRSVAYTDGPDVVSGPREAFTLLSPDIGRTQRAAERVRRFLVARSTMGGVDPTSVYQVGEPGTGELIDLRTGDLEALVRTVLGDVPTRETRRPGTLTGPTLPAGMTWEDARRAEANYNDDDTEETK